VLSRRILLAAACSAILWDRTALAADPLDDLLARVARARASVRTMQGPFTQVRTLGLLATEVRSSGTLILVRPDRLRWELAPPDQITFFVGPEGVAYRDARGQTRMQGANTRMAAALDDLRTLLAGDIGRLRDRWDLRVLRDDGTGAEVDALPKTASSSPLRGLRFTLAPDLIRPTRALLVEGPRDRTVIEFGALLVDAPVDPARVRP
jgi:hypothetical protein